MAVATDLLPATSVSLIAASLSLRRFNPRVAMLQSLCALDAAPTPDAVVTAIPFVHLTSGVCDCDDSRLYCRHLYDNPKQVQPASLQTTQNRLYLTQSNKVSFNLCMLSSSTTLCFCRQNPHPLLMRLWFTATLCMCLLCFCFCSGGH